MNECAIQRLNRKELLPSYEMADLYAPQGVDMGGGHSPQEKWNGKWPKQENCKATFENIQKVRF